ncbi:Cardiolipin synthase, ClsA [hydrothermal vent metagenome]|uniref:Cardiolipin synthase, ClsA n=1 Tax=hydrothermal vent metagenome TaxID=652676 RepID=A0A3B0RN54_9ZZZZ
MYTLALHSLLVVGFTLRILARDGLLPSSRMAWFMVVLTLPFVGSALYFLFGEVDLGHRANTQQRRIFKIIHEFASKTMPPPDDLGALVKPHFRAAFRYARSINGFNPLNGNRAKLLPDAQSARARLIDDIDAATETVHILYYIWLNDCTGTNVANALIRAAKRGVICRVMVDGLGSRVFVKSPLWKQMSKAGVQTAIALPINRPIRTLLTSRLDLRNHRKITVIDGSITYCGSQNCADPEFRVKEKYAPWVDIVLRMQGPVVAQQQMLFASDWMKENDTPIDQLQIIPQPPARDGFVAQALGDGPTERMQASPQMFVTLIETAQDELIITTPYFVPDATVFEALCAAAYRQVKVMLIVPKHNDSWIVAAASKSFYRKLLESGARIYEYQGGLLHSKTLTIDGQLLFMGSSNMDMRSFDLNYENDVLIQDPDLTKSVRQRQMTYISSSDIVQLDEVTQWHFHHRIWNNVIATVGPVL